MKNVKKLIFILKVIFMSLMIGCEIEPQETTSGLGALLQPGDIVVSSYSADSAILLDPDGNFKKLLYNPDNNLESVYGVGWNPTTNEVVISINGSPDRIMAISAIDGTVREAVRHNQLNGNTFGITVDTDGNYYAVESNNIEKFDAFGSRNTDGFPVTNLMSNLNQVSFMSTGEFLACSNGTDRVRIYDSSLVQQSEANSGIGGTTDSYGCQELSNGNIAVSWYGSNDSVIIYDENLTPTGDSFSDTTLMPTPRGIGARSNGNILIADSTYDWIIELDSNANFVRTIGSGIISDPWQVLVIPEF